MNDLRDEDDLRDAAHAPEGEPSKLTIEDLNESQNIAASPSDGAPKGLNGKIMDITGDAAEDYAAEPRREASYPMNTVNTVDDYPKPLPPVLKDLPGDYPKPVPPPEQTIGARMAPPVEKAERMMPQAETNRPRPPKREAFADQSDTAILNKKWANTCQTEPWQSGSDPRQAGGGLRTAPQDPSSFGVPFQGHIRPLMNNANVGHHRTVPPIKVPAIAEADRLDHMSRGPEWSEWTEFDEEV